MKLLFVIILFLFACPSLAENEMYAVDKKQRKLVSRFYETLELMPNRCPKSVRGEYIESVVKFEKVYPEFITLV